MKKLLATSLMALGIAAAFPTAYAQSADPAAAPAGPRAMARHHDRAFKPADRLEARLAYLRTALKITPDQQPQWDAYAEVRRKHVAAMQKRFQERRSGAQQTAGAERRRPTAVERHERQRARLAVTAQRLDELLAVEKPLYAALSPEQQRIADEVLAPRMRAGARGHGRFHRAGFGRG